MTTQMKWYLVWGWEGSQVQELFTMELGCPIFLAQGDALVSPAVGREMPGC